MYGSPVNVLLWFMGLMGGYIAWLMIIADIVAQHRPDYFEDKGWNYVPPRIQHQALLKRIEALEAKLEELNTKK